MISSKIRNLIELKTFDLRLMGFARLYNEGKDRNVHLRGLISAKRKLIYHSFVCAENGSLASFGFRRLRKEAREYGRF